MDLCQPASQPTTKARYTARHSTQGEPKPIGWVGKCAEVADRGDEKRKKDEAETGYHHSSPPSYCIALCGVCMQATSLLIVFKCFKSCFYSVVHHKPF